MKRIGRFQSVALLVPLLLTLAWPSFAGAAVMNDYCVVPAFITQSAPSNLLLMIDNSSSMYDLTYTDPGYGTCSVTTSKNCSVVGDCPVNETCNLTRAPFTCYDESYQSTKTYSGYFTSDIYYAFDFTNKYFTPNATLPAASSCSWSIPSTLCVSIDSQPKVVSFVALGKYLNWLTASKFDVEKGILTGGKYVGHLCKDSNGLTDRSCNTVDDCPSGQSCEAVSTNFLQAETRGCLGQGFIKGVLRADFQNYITKPDPNATLGVTFAVRGPRDSANDTAPSRGGQSYIEVYNGTYNNQACQDATTAWINNSSNLTTAIQTCLNYNPHASPPNYCSLKVSMTGCVTDSDCIVNISTPTPGGCSAGSTVTNPPGCYSDGDCGSSTTPGTCTNVVRSCLNDANCDVSAVIGGCSNSGSIGCWNDTTCGTSPGNCTNVTRACMSATDCTVTAVAGGCSNSPSTTCTSDPNCNIATSVGGCTFNPSQLCTADATCQASASICTNTDASGHSISCSNNTPCLAGSITVGRCTDGATSGTGTSCTTSCSGLFKYMTGTCTNSPSTHCTKSTDCTFLTLVGGCSNNGLTCTSTNGLQDPACTTTVTPGNCTNTALSCSTSGCANSCSNSLTTACTSNANCPMSNGNCNNTATSGTGLTCSGDPACSSLKAYHSGHCSNWATQGCNVATQNTDCLLSIGSCGDPSNTQCVSDSTCSGLRTYHSGQCANFANNGRCTYDSECRNTQYPTGYCSGATAATCTGKSSQTGTCSGETTATCTQPAPARGTCTVTNTCSAPAPVLSNGSCTAPPPPTSLTGTCSGGTAATCTAPAPNPPTSGSCQLSNNLCNNPPPNISSGTCTSPPPVPPSTGTCTNPSPSPNHCNNPPPITASTGTCTNPKPVTTNYTCTNPPPTAVGTTDYGPCVNPTHSGVVNTKITMTQSVQTCNKCLTASGGCDTSKISNGDVNRLTQGGKCDATYGSWGLCHNDYTASCSVDGDCASGKGPCDHGPATILPGNPALICSTTYLGQFCSPNYWNSGSGASGCTWDTSNTTAVNTVFVNFCGGQQPTVIDPSTTTSSTNFQQLPALLASVGAEGQLGTAIGTLPVRVKTDTGPTGLIQQYSDRLRIGAMHFNFNGSPTEVTSLKIAAPQVCSNDHTRICTMNADCPGGSCLSAASSAAYNLDGGQITYGSYIGEGQCVTLSQTTCSSNTTCTTGTCVKGFCGVVHTSPTRCTNDGNCATGDTCVSSGAGDHTTGLVNSIDSIRANAWTPLAEAFYEAIGYFGKTSSGTSRTDLRLNSSDYDETLNPSQYVCQANYILLITDGSSTADQHASVKTLADTYQMPAQPAGQTPTNWDGACTYYAGSTYLPILSWLAFNKNINSTDFSASKKWQNDYISTYVVSTGGPSTLSGGDECNPNKLLTDTAVNGGGKIYQANDPQTLSSSLKSVFESLADAGASGTAASILSNSEGSGANILQAIFYPRKVFKVFNNSSQTWTSTQAYWLGELHNLWYYVDPFLGNSTMREDTNKDSTLELKSDYVLVFNFDVAKGGITTVQLFQDTAGTGAGDAVAPCAESRCYQIQGDSNMYVKPDDINSLWRAGRQLYARDLTVSPRTIYTPCNSIGGGDSNPAGGTCIAGTGLMQFSLNPAATYTGLPSGGFPAGAPDNSAAVQANLQAATLPAARKLIRYVHGFDYPGDTTMRSRTVQWTMPDGTVLPAATISTDPASLYVTNPSQNGKGVWKLGDIISSTPRTESSIRQNAYNLPKPSGYGDTTYGDDSDPNNKRGYIFSSGYLGRGMAFAGANDGMLHAFNLGILNVNATGDTKAKLTGAGLGDEAWAFMPQNALPYLTYYADPDYSHVYFMDGNTQVADVSAGSCTGLNYWDCTKHADGSNWRTYLVGGMGIGGASRDSTDTTCTEGIGGDCVKTPITGVGYSSYYALDVTNPASPIFKWEFSDASLPAADRGLGFTTSGVALVKISAKMNPPVKICSQDSTRGCATDSDCSAGQSCIVQPDPSKNGHWFAVFGSGPTGPIDKSAQHRFMGTSDQPLKVYIVDLNTTAPFTKGTNYWVIDKVYDGGSSSNAKISGLTPVALNNAFAGKMSGGTIDLDRWKSDAPGNYQDDAVYFGYSQLDSTPGVGTWTKGGVLRLVTGENPDPSTWKVVKVIDNTGPITTGIGRLQDRKNHNLWLYFGSGRYFYLKDDFNTGVGERVYGIKDPCYRNGSTTPADTLDATCAVKYSAGSETDQTNATLADQTINSVGWSVALDLQNIDPDPTLTYGGERIITDPIAMTNGAVFFTSYKPNFDFCQYGGNSYMWAFKFDSGTEAPTQALQGKALVQVSTGQFAPIDLSTAFTDKLKRRMAKALTGKPPEDAPPLISKSNNKPVKRIIHIQEH